MRGGLLFMVENLMQAHIFEFTGGLLCLDFTNTLEDRPSDHPRELLNSYSDLVSWSQQARILEDQEAQQLLEEAARRPAEAYSSSTSYCLTGGDLPALQGSSAGRFS